ncbi:MAG: folate family ECF transporter S component [Clostridiales bacterium]|nr:folate family ECF transporter S component [Clostridiales bacterium]
MINDQQEIATPDIRKKSNVRSQQIKFGTTKWLTYTAVFAALSLVMKFIGQFLTLTPNFKITPIYVVWLISAAVLGPVGGGIVCFVSDVLGAIIFPMGALNPLLTLGCTLYGVIAGLCFKYFPVKNYIAKFLFAGIACTLLITLLFDSFAIWWWCRYYLHLKSYLEKGFWVYVGASRVLQLAVGAINIVVTVMMIPLLTKLRLLPPLNKKAKSTEEHDHA